MQHKIILTQAYRQGHAIEFLIQIENDSDVNVFMGGYLGDDKIRITKLHQDTAAEPTSLLQALAYMVAHEAYIIDQIRREQEQIVKISRYLYKE